MPILLPPEGGPCWFELASADPQRSADYHRELFGWQGHPVPGGAGPYWFLRSAKGTIGAMRGLAPGEPRGYWNIYFAVRDVDAALARAEALGGKRLFDPFEAPGFGRGAMLTDAVGAVVSLWQPEKPADAGDFVMYEDHAIGWVELAARDGDRARDFYRDLLGWSIAESTPSGFRYLDRSVADAAPEAREAARIRLERSHAALLLIAGEADGLWGAAEAAQRIADRLAAARHPRAVQVLRYPDAGHVVYIGRTLAADDPLLARFEGMGGTPEGTRAAINDAWPKSLRFLREQLAAEARPAG